MPWPSFPFSAAHPPSADELQRLLERLKAHVNVLAGLIGPRHLDKPTSLEAAAAYIERQFKELGDTVARQPYKVGNAEVANLVLERRGSKYPEQIIVVGAHYDTVPSTPGADDNASAVAMLIEVARLLQSAAPRRTIRFVAFPCEEPPHFYTDSMGSQEYARNCRARQEDIVGMLCLEMVGYYSSQPGSQQIPATIPAALRGMFPRKGNFLAAVGNMQSVRLLWKFRRGFKRVSGFPLFSVPLPERVREIRLSDNSSFWGQGYPALMITDTSFLRNPHYHLPTDTPETLDFESLAKATIGVAGGAGAVAGIDKV